MSCFEDYMQFRDEVDEVRKKKEEEEEISKTKVKVWLFAISSV
jgi:hypothetical protein